MSVIETIWPRFVSILLKLGDSQLTWASEHQQMAFIINSVGNALTPFDSFLLLRGIKTLAIRMDRQQSTAMLVAQLLSRLGFVTHYPGLPNHPGKEVHERIADGKAVA